MGQEIYYLVAIAILIPTSLAVDSESIQQSDFTTFTEFNTREQIHDISISANGKYIAIGDFWNVYLLDLNGKLLAQYVMDDYEKYGDTVSGVSASSNGLMAVSVQDGVFLFDSDGLLWQYEKDDDESLRNIHPTYFDSVAISPDGNYIVTSTAIGSYHSDTSLLLFDKQGKLLWKRPMYEGVPLRSLVFSSDGSIIAAGGENSLYLLDIEGRLLGGYQMAKAEYWRTPVDISSTADYIVATDTKGVVYAFDLNRSLWKSQVPVSQYGWTPMVKGVAYCSNYAVALTSTSKVHILDKENGNLLITLDFRNDNGRDIAATDDCRLMVVGYGSTASFVQKLGNALFVIDSDPKGARVLLDNQYLGDTPLTVPINVGKHVISVRHEGYDQYVETFAVYDEHDTKCIAKELLEDILCANNKYTKNLTLLLSQAQMSNGSSQNNREPAQPQESTTDENASQPKPSQPRDMSAEIQTQPYTPSFFIPDFNTSVTIIGTVASIIGTVVGIRAYKSRQKAQ